MIKIVKAFCIFIISSIFLNVQAEEPPLKLNDAMLAAIRTHPAVINKKDEFDAAVHGLEASKWGRFPAFSAQTMVGQLNGEIINSVTLDQPVWAGGRIDAAIAASEAKLIGAGEAISEAEQQILNRTVSAFFEIIRLQTRLNAADENVLEYQRLLDLISRRAKNQISPESEVIQAKARLEQAKGEKLQMQVAMLNAKADLEQLISQPISKLQVPSFVLDVSNDLDMLVSAALNFSPQIKRLNSEIKASDAEVDAKKSALMPQLSVRYQKFWGGNFPDDRTFIALTMQPGNGLSAFSHINESRSKMHAAESSRDVAKKEIADSVRTDWVKVRSAKSEVEVFNQLAESTRGVYESTVRQYAVGRKSWMEVLNARREATQAKYSLADSQWNGYLSLIRLKIITGEIMENGAAIDGLGAR